MSRNFTDELWKLLPKYASTALEKNLLTVAPFDSIIDPKVKVLRRAKGDWLGWHLLSDTRGRLTLDSNGNPQVIHDANFWMVNGSGELVVDENGEEIVSDPDWSRRYLVVGDSSYLYWLGVEYGVHYLSEILPDVSDRIAGGIELNRIAGTPAAIQLVMRWLNFPYGKVIQEREPTIHFPEYQLDLGRYATLEELQILVRAVRFAEPVRSRLRRVLFSYDRDRFLLDSSKWGDLLDDYSDVRIDSLLDGHPQMKASFRRPSTDTVEQLVPQWDSSRTST